MAPAELEKLVIQLEEEMFAAAEELRFEYAAKLRDEIKELRRELQAAAEAPAGLGFRRARRDRLRPWSSASSSAGSPAGRCRARTRCRSG